MEICKHIVCCTNYLHGMNYGRGTYPPFNIFYKFIIFSFSFLMPVWIYLLWILFSVSILCGHACLCMRVCILFINSLTGWIRLFMTDTFHGSPSFLCIPVVPVGDLFVYTLVRRSRCFSAPKRNSARNSSAGSSIWLLFLWRMRRASSVFFPHLCVGIENVLILCLNHMLALNIKPVIK